MWLTACGGRTPALPDVWVEPTTGLEFVLIRAGVFEMGLRAGEPGDVRPAPLHSVTLSEPFYLGRFEVTQRQWFDVMGSRPSQFGDCGDDCPVESVSWEDAQDFVRRLGEADAGEEFRLPTEAYCAYPGTSVVDPVGTCATDTVPIRGGSFYFSANAARCGRRYTHARTDSGFSLSFRVVRVVRP